MIIRILFFLLPILTFSQESQTITFTTKSKLFAPAYKLETNTNEVNTIRADVQTKHGDFSIILIDYNKNGLFNDYRGCCNDLGGSDGITMLDYSATKSKIIHYDRIYITKKYPIAINGFTYRLSNLHQNKKGVYIAILTKRIVESKEVFKSRNRLIIDKIPKDSVQYYYSKNKTTIPNLLSKEHKTLFVVSSMNGFTIDLQFFNSNYIKYLSKYFKDIEVIRIVVPKKKNSYSYMLKKYNKKENDFLILKISENQKLMNFGYNKNGKNTFLVNEKGEIEFTDLYEFMFINKMKERAYKEKIKNNQ